MQIHQSWRRHPGEPDGVRSPSLQVAEGDPCVPPCSGSETQPQLQGVPLGASSSTDGLWGHPALILADPHFIHLLWGEDQCQPLRRMQRQCPTPAVT